ncbi:MAG: PaaI family thioesterase [Nannocystaceae bacterium]|nr:PaaI family thioesterase [Deltaproteobacteria bacterium]MBP7285386.1 PaaI family thioesterase [Nannocystaceae bacterium]
MASDTEPALAAERFVAMVEQGLRVAPEFRWRLRAWNRGRVDLELDYDDAFERPGGTISGPTMFTLADLTLWAAVCSIVGYAPLAVTAHMAIHFLRRPRPVALLARCEVLKAGRRLIHGDVRMHSVDRPGEVVCHATGAYAIPETSTSVPSSAP